jgi:hypothetical protein
VGDLRGAGAIVACCLLAVGCGGGVATHRNLDEPRGYTSVQGAAKNTTYSAQVQTSHHRLHVTVFEKSECDVIKVRLVSRTRETLQDGQVIDREAPTLVQIEEGVEGTSECEKRYARDVLVILQVGDATYRLGETSTKGELHINLADLLKRSLHGTDGPPPAEALLLVQGHNMTEPLPAGTVSLSQLEAYEKRVDELLAEFGPLLEKEQEKLSGKEFARSYELYQQLDRINAGDARIEALQARFLELVFGRKEKEATASLERNLKALAKAKELLAALAREPAYQVPVFVQMAIESERPSTQALRWARGQLALGIRQEPDLCGPKSGAFSWDWFAQRRWPLATELALTFLRYAYSDTYAAQVQSLCSRAARW